MTIDIIVSLTAVIVFIYLSFGMLWWFIEKFSLKEAIFDYIIICFWPIFIIKLFFLKRKWGNTVFLLMNNKINYIECANLIKTVSLKFGDERASKCAYDLLMSMSNGYYKKCKKAWENYIEEGVDGAHTETIRNGIWVPAIPIN